MLKQENYVLIQSLHRHMAWRWLNKKTNICFNSWSNTGGFSHCTKDQKTPVKVLNKSKLPQPSQLLNMSIMSSDQFLYIYIVITAYSWTPRQGVIWHQPRLKIAVPLQCLIASKWVPFNEHCWTLPEAIWKTIDNLSGHFGEDSLSIVSNHLEPRKKRVASYKCDRFDDILQSLYPQSSTVPYEKPITKTCMIPLIICSTLVPIKPNNSKKISNGTHWMDPETWVSNSW